MKDAAADRAVAIVGVAAIMPDAPDAAAFWQNIQDGRYSISDVDAGPLGPGALLRPRPAARPTRPTRRSAAGSAPSSGIRSAGSSPIPPRVSDAMDDAQKWAVTWPGPP